MGKKRIVPITPKKSYKDFLDFAKDFNKIQPIYYDPSKIWWFWDDKHFKWNMGDEIDIMNLVTKKTGLYNTTQSTTRNQTIESLKRIGRENKPIKPKPTWIQFKDKIIDIIKGTEIKPNPTYFISNPIPFNLGKTTKTPNMDRIFEEWVGKKYVPTLYEIIAFCCLADYPLNRIFFFLGSGMNGKSKFLELIKKFVGDYNTTSTELETLLSSRFEHAKLHKKLVCFMGETNLCAMNKTSMLKKLSGGDYIGFEMKNKTPFDDKNYAKLLIATNNLPSTTDKTVGFFRRCIIIDFPMQFNESKDILNDIPDIEYENLASKVIPIIKSLIKNREFTNEGSIKERTKRFEERSDPLGKFMKEEIIEDSEEWIGCYDFKENLDGFCEMNGFRKLTTHEVSKVLQNEFGLIKTVRPNELEHKIKVWIGIRLKNKVLLKDIQTVTEEKLN